VTTGVLQAKNDLMSTLRGVSALRPEVDRGLSGGLRAWLEDGLFERLGVLQPGAVRLTARSCSGATQSANPTALLRGALLGVLLRLHVAGADLPDPYEAAVTALRASGRDQDLLAPLDELDSEDAARLAAEVDAHHAVLGSTLGSIPSRWSPRCGVRMVVPLAGGGVVLRGTVDLALGVPGGTRTCVCLLDVTTTHLREVNDEALAYLALLETLRTGEPPLRVAALSTADGDATVHDVTTELLAGAVDAVLATACEVAATT
jgi:hypothetical protein